MFRRFILIRKVDVTGVSGTGYVAEGCEFSNGKVAVSWKGKHPTITAHDNLKSVETIHLHAGATELQWLDYLPHPEPEMRQRILDALVEAQAYFDNKQGASDKGSAMFAARQVLQAAWKNLDI